MKLEQDHHSTNNRFDSTPRPSVFISYSHDSEGHSRKVLRLSDRLVGDGVNCILDQYEQAPPNGWVKWMSQSIDTCDYVLIVCTRSYAEKTTDKCALGMGAKFESLLVYQDLYENASNGHKLVPIIFRTGDRAHIPKPLRAFQHYVVVDDRGYEDLYRRLTGQPRIVKPDPGEMRLLGVGENIPGQEHPVTAMPAPPQKQAILEEQSSMTRLIELRIDADFQDFSPEHQLAFLKAIQELLTIGDSDLHVRRIRKGSVKILLELPYNAATRLLDLFAAGKLAPLSVIDATDSSQKIEVGGLSTISTAKNEEGGLHSQSVRTGTVKWFNDAKGFGFITPDDGSADIFAHFSAILGAHVHSLRVGQRVTFEVVRGSEGLQVKNVSALTKRH